MKVAAITLVVPADDYGFLRKAGHEQAFDPARGQSIAGFTEDELIATGGDPDCLI